MMPGLLSVAYAGLIIARLVGGNATRFVPGVAVAHTAFTLYTFIEALAGQPFLPGLG